MPTPVLPDYGGACIDRVVPLLLHREQAVVPEWLPAGVAAAGQVVLLVLDGLGWEQLQDRPQVAPLLSQLAGGPITSVVPTTTATALTSITTGSPPAYHEMVGYRVKSNDEVLNVLRWRTASGDARERVPPAEFQSRPVFEGRRVPVVTRAEFAASGFTQAHLNGVELVGWQLPSSLVAHVGRLLGRGDRFVYAYYDGIDKVAHEYGFGAFYDAELAAADRLTADLVRTLGAGAALVVTADHGQVEVADATITLPDRVLSDVVMISGEGRFRWLHARPGTAQRLAVSAKEAFGDVAWVCTVDELEAEGWYGGPLSAVSRARLGDVALVPFAPVAFLDPADTGENRLRCRHGSLTGAEMWVPLLASVG
jgi:hypothetical protein